MVTRASRFHADFFSEKFENFIDGVRIRFLPTLSCHKYTSEGFSPYFCFGASTVPHKNTTNLVNETVCCNFMKAKIC